MYLGLCLYCFQPNEQTNGSLTLLTFWLELTLIRSLSSLGTTSLFQVVCVCLVIQLHLTLCDPMGCSPPGSSVHGFSRQERWSGSPRPPLGNLAHPGIEPGSPALQADSLPSEPQGSQLLFSR